MPGIFVEAMAFAGEDQQSVGNAEGIERVLEQIIFEHGDADVVGAGDHVGGGADFVDLEDGGFVVIALGGFPGASAEEVGIVEGGVVVAPVAYMLDRPGAGDGGFEARGLSDEPVGHVAAVAVAADGEMIGVGEAIFHEGVDAFENIFAGAGDDDGNDLLKEFVAVSGGATVVGLEDEPAVGGGERGPLIPVGFEVVAVGVGGATVNEGEHGQVFGTKFSGRVDQHSFDGGAVVGLPAVGLALGKVALGEKFVEGSDGAGLVEFVGAFG